MTFLKSHRQLSLNAIMRWMLIFIMIALSGAVYFTQIYRLYVTLAFLAVTVVTIVIENKRISRESMYITIGFIVILMANYVVNANGMTFSNMIDYCVLMIEIICVTGVTSIVSIDEFSEKYIRILEIIAIISLICFFIQITNTSLVNRLANTTILEGYSVSWFHTWGWTYIFNRNSGPFWEPGAFQGYLFIAVLFIMRNGNLEKRCPELLLLMLTILTTKSTTVYILVGFLGAYFFLMYTQNSIKAGRVKVISLFWSVIFFVVIMAGLVLLMRSPIILNKFSSSNESFSYRILHLTRSVSMVMEKPFIGFGMMSSSLLKVWEEFGIASNSAGLFVILQFFGLIIGIAYISLSFFSTVKVFMPLNGIFICICFSALHLTECLLTFPVYFGFVFFAINMEKTKIRYSV